MEQQYIGIITATIEEFEAIKNIIKIDLNEENLDNDLL